MCVHFPCVGPVSCRLDPWARNTHGRSGTSWSGSGVDRGWLGTEPWTLSAPEGLCNQMRQRIHMGFDIRHIGAASVGVDAVMRVLNPIIVRSSGLHGKW